MMTDREAIEHVAQHLVGYLNGLAADEVYETDDSQSERQIEKAMRRATLKLLKWGKPRNTLVNIKKGLV